MGRIQASALALKVVTGFPRGQLTGVSALLGDLGPASADSVVQQCLLRAWPAACSTWAEAASLRAKAASVQEDSPAEVTSSSVGEAFPHRLGSFLHLASLSSPTGAVVSVWFFFLQLAEVSRMVLLFSVEFVVVPSGCWGLRQRFQVLSGPSEAFLLPSVMC